MSPIYWEVLSQCFYTGGSTFPHHTGVSCILEQEVVMSPSPAGARENDPLVSTSASFCTAELEHPREVTTKMHFWVEGRSNNSYINVK